jgi:general secretion pathway protein K
MDSRRNASIVAAGHRQSGLALIAVLWLTVMLTVIASGFAFSMRSEVLSARNALSSAQARVAADGAIERTMFELQRPRNLPDVWVADGTPRTWQEGEATIIAIAVDEAAKIDLNSAPDGLLKGLLMNVGGVDPDKAQHLVEAIADWKDPDDLRRPNGAEDADYRSAGTKYHPTNMPFAVVGELQRVLGMTPEVYAKVADSLTVQSRQAGVNVTTASRNVLLSIPGVTPEAVDNYIAQRDAARAAKLPLPAFPAAGGVATGAAAVWRIRAQATLPDGATFIREAVVRASPYPKRPIIALLWQEGSLSDPLTIPPTDASSANAPAASTDGNRPR